MRSLAINFRTTLIVVVANRTLSCSHVHHMSSSLTRVLCALPAIGQIAKDDERSHLKIRVHEAAGGDQRKVF